MTHSELTSLPVVSSEAQAVLKRCVRNCHWSLRFKAGAMIDASDVNLGFIDELVRAGFVTYEIVRDGDGIEITATALGARLGAYMCS